MNNTGGRLETELPIMEQAANHVREVNGEIQAQLSKLLNNLEPLKGAWKGGAAMSFDTVKQQWHENATKLNGALLGISESLGQSRQTYQAGEDRNREAITKIAEDLLS